jgi:hypothetical protein
MRAPRAVAALLAATALASCMPGPPATKDYAYPAWGFKAAFQAPPTETAQPASADGTTPSAYLVEASAGGRDFAVWAADVSKANVTLDELASSASDHVAKGLGATAGIPAYAATGGGVEGREYAFTKDGKWQASMSVFLAGGRFYEVIAKSALGEDDPAVKNFLFSFTPLGGGPATNAAPATNTP